MLEAKLYLHCNILWLFTDWVSHFTGTGKGSVLLYCTDFNKVSMQSKQQDSFKVKKNSVKCNVWTRI